MAYILCRLHAPRPTFPADMTAAEGEAMAAHGTYWAREAAAGQAIAVGPVFDPAGAWGFALVDVADEAAARALTDADPIVTASLGFHYDHLPVPSLILRGPAAA
jgi:uncharacterized protein YciI